MDVAGALGMMKKCKVGQKILLARTNDDPQYVRDLVQVVTLLLSAELDEKAQGIARVVVSEVVFPISCSECLKRGRVASKTKYDLVGVICSKCKGYGIQWKSGRQRAVIAGIPWTTYRRKEYDKVISYYSRALETLAGDAQRQLEKQ